MTGVGTADFEDHCWRDVVSPETLEIYAPYRREVGLRGSVTLLAIDLFAGVFPDREEPTMESIKKNPRSCGEYAWAALPKIQALLGGARAQGWPILFTTSALLAPEADGGPVRQATFRSRSGGTADDRADFAIDPRFTVQPEDQIVYKARASAFFDTDLDERLRKLDTETLLICGESTSGCVRATAVDGYSHGYHVALAEECVFDRHLLGHQISLFDLHHKYADVLHLDEVIGG